MRRKAAVLALTAAISACMSLTALAAGWSKDGEEYIWLKDDGTRAVNEWVEDQGKWYFFEDRGWMVTGWWPVNGSWYYLRESGADAGAAVMGQTFNGWNFDASGAYVPAIRPADNPPDNGHEYYKNITEDKIRESEAICWLEAALILNNPELDTDYKKVKAAYETVQKYMSYAGDKEPADADYRSPAGVYTSGYWSCAGTTRAMGRLLDYMGYPWQHANPDKGQHQWCIVMMDGQIGCADPQGMVFHYGAHPYDRGSEMTVVGELGAAGTNGSEGAQSYITGTAVPRADGYDPAHPLARLIDRWHLCLDTSSPEYRGNYRGSMYNHYGHVVAWLTGQEGMFPDITRDGDSMAVAAKVRDYLNTFDIENASEMERAKKLGELIRGWKIDKEYAQEKNGHADMYNLLVYQKCDNYNSVAWCMVALAEWFGLPSCTTGTGYFPTGVVVRVDGKPYWCRELRGFDFSKDYWHDLGHARWDPRDGYLLETLLWSDGQTETWRPVRDDHGIHYEKYEF